MGLRKSDPQSNEDPKKHLLLAVHRTANIYGMIFVLKYLSTKVLAVLEEDLSLGFLRLMSMQMTRT